MHSLRNSFQQLLRDARSQKLRLILTIFGIVWGTAAVTLLLAFGEGMHKRMLVSQKGLGDAIVIAWPSRTSKPWEGLPRGRPVRMTREDVGRLRGEVPEIDRLSEEYRRNGSRLVFGTKALSIEVVGTNVEFATMRNLIPQRGGRYIDHRDLEQRRRVIFLGDQLAKDIFGEGVDPVGKHARLDGVPFLVVGVMLQKDQDSSYSGRDKDKATIPSTTFESVYGPKYVDNFIVQVLDSKAVPAAKEKLLAAAAPRHRFDPSDEEAIQMWDTTEGIKFMDTFFTAFRAFLGIVGALTLLVGGIGVSNIMNVAVEERTKEIGIKMALGARRRFILGQFLFETLLLIIAGGALGFLISWGICAAFPSFGLGDFVGEPTISPQVALFTTAILGAIGLVAGYFPARAAASLKPVEALRM